MDKLEEIEKIAAYMYATCFYLIKKLNDIPEKEVYDISKSCDEDYYKIKKIISEIKESL